ncbi:MAG: WG repeat-containing protein [Bacteroidota bacterium]
MDTLGQVAIEGDYYQVNAFESFGMTGVQSARSPRKWGYINTQGEMLIEPQFDYIMGSPSYEQEIDFAYSSTTGYTVVNKTLRKAVMDSVGAYYYCPGFSQWIGIKKMNGKAGFIDKAGNVVVPFDFTDVDCFDNLGLAPAKNEKYWGFINTDGDFIKEPEYIFVHKFEDDDYAIVSPYLTTVGMINRQGEMVIPPDFYNFKTRNGIKAGWELLFAWGKNGAGYIDRSGAFVTQTHFLDKGYNFHDREYAAARDSSHYVGLINRQGEFVIPAQFDYLQFEGDSDILKYVIDRKTGYFSLDQQRYFVYPKDTLAQMIKTIQATRGPDWKGF